MPDHARVEFVPASYHGTHWSSPKFTQNLRVGALVAVAYYVGSLIGFRLRFPASGIGYIWPPNGILLAALFVVDPRSWPTILGAAFAAHGIAHEQDGVPVATWVWQFLANGMQAVLAAAIVRGFGEQSLRFDTLRGVTVFVGGAALAAPAIASVIPLPAYMKMGWAGDYWAAWGMRTVTNVVTTLTLVPPLIAIFGENRRAMSGLTLARAAEFIALLLALSAVGLFVFLRTGSDGLPPALYACLPFLAWAAARFGIPGLSLCLLALACLLIAVPGDRMPSGESLSVRTILGIQLFVAFGASPLMFLSVVLEEARHVRRTEEALRQSEAKTAAILRAIPDLMFVQSRDSDHRYLDYYAWSPSELFAPPDQFLGKAMRDVLPADLARSFEDVFEQAVASGEPRVLEYSLLMGGETQHYEARVVSCDDDKVLSIVRNTTERKTAETALHKAQHELARMSRASALGELAASIAHEVQQPLSAIGANAAACARWLAQDAPDVGQIRAALADIVGDSNRANQVIRRTRELFSGGSREQRPVELTSAIREVLAILRNRAVRGGDHVRLELDEGPLIVMGDRVQLQQVLLNLVTNSLDALRQVPREQREMLVRSWRSEGFVHVAVRDNGRGFGPEDIERIFDPFYTTKSDGLGMGLAISRSIVRAHGGRLEATLNPAGGATFELAIPAAEPTG